MPRTDNPSEKQLQETFLQDSSSVLNNVYRYLLQLEKSPSDKSLIHDIFRDIHSLKSESSYLRLDELTRATYRFETILGDIREGKEAITKETLDSLFATLDVIQAETEKATDELRRDLALHAEGQSPSSDRRSSLFNDFEKKLIREAYERGESFYRVVCELDPQTSMKFPRVYLLINNLELLVNVIKVVPDIYDIENNRDEGDRIEVYFTTSVPEEKVYDSLNVDEVQRIQIASVDYDTYVVKNIAREAETETISEERPSAFLNVETGKIDDISNYIDELQMRVHNLQANKEKAGNDVAKLNNLADNLDRLLKTIRRVPLKNEFDGLYRLVRDTASTVNKKVDFYTTGGDIDVDRSVLGLLSDMLRHLVRNAVDHGIEPPELRASTGKPKAGSVMVAAHRVDKRLIVQVCDDGQGIASEKELSNDKLLDMISEPGFTTKKEKTDSSGMGVGLDIVRAKIAGTEGASLRMITQTGNGTVFTLEIPESYALTVLLLARSGEMTVGIPKRNIENTVLIDSSLYERDGSGGVTYEGRPVFTCNGRVYMKETYPNEEYGILLSYLDSSVYLLVDEILFEKEAQNSQIKFEEGPSPHLKTLYIGNNKTDFLYLDPKLIG